MVYYLYRWIFIGLFVGFGGIWDDGGFNGIFVIFAGGGRDFFPGLGL